MDSDKNANESAYWHHVWDLGDGRYAYFYVPRAGTFIEWKICDDAPIPRDGGFAATPSPLYYRPITEEYDSVALQRKAHRRLLEDPVAFLMSALL